MNAYTMLKVAAESHFSKYGNIRQYRRIMAAADALADIDDIAGWYERGEIDPDEAFNQVGKLTHVFRREAPDE